MKEKGDACIFVGYYTQSRAYRVFNKRTRVIVETIHVNFDELPQMASDHVSSGPIPQFQRMALEYDGLSPGPQSNGYAQKEGVDFKESFATVARLEAVRLFIAYALYGLKQAPRAWYDELSNFLVSKGFSKGSINPTLLIAKHGEDILLVQIYVDDIIFGSTNPKLSKQFEKLMHNNFEMSMREELKFYLGIQIHQSPCGIFINQAKYAHEILIKHAKPTKKHLTAVKQIFRYLKDTINMELWYPKDTGFEVTTFSDSDHVGCLDSHKITSGSIQFLGGDKLVSWSSKKQDCTSIYSAEVEYVSLSACCAQVLWLRTQLTDYGFYFDKIPMYCDSKPAIAISCNPV
nr:hypothetical protein [Tanacetum cinerariifolium]